MIDARQSIRSIVLSDVFRRTYINIIDHPLNWDNVKLMSNTIYLIRYTRTSVMLTYLWV